MKWTSSAQGLECVIITDEYTQVNGSNPQTVYRLFVYKDKIDVYDDLQFTLAFAKEVAHDQFSIPLNSWQQLD